MGSSACVERHEGNSNVRRRACFGRMNETVAGATFFFLSFYVPLYTITTRYNTRREQGSNAVDVYVCSENGYEIRTN